ncbi:MAG: hypothetical protein N4A41_00435 [Crocinitomicaceae bacterium]|jgi:hypothetical protein|nr:hypothetical protein [Crocinitomicaceae bacterium]
MYTPWFNALKTQIQAKTNDFKLIDVFNNQYEQYNQEKTRKFPHLFIEFPGEITWNEQSNKVQHAPAAEIVFHIVNMDLKDSPLPSMDLHNTLHDALNHHALIENDIQISSSMTRIGTELVATYTQLKVLKIKYSLDLYDYRFIDQLDDLENVELRVTKE